MATIQDLGKVAYFNKGAYNSQTNYEINDVVSYNGSSYVSLDNNNQGNLPTNTTYWSVVALKGDKGDTGKPFVIEKTYESIEDMVADYDNMEINDYVMIQGSIEEEENATLWTKTETEVSPYKWVYLADFSGASGITGATPNIQIGTVTEGNEPAVTRRAGSSNENPILDFVLKTGATGQTGATGNGISSVSKTSTSGLTDTYTIEYTSGNSTTYNVTNGKGIASVTKTSSSGLVDTYTITYNDGTTSTYTITNGEDGEVTQEQLDETNSEIELLKKIYNAFPTTTGENESITLNGTAEVQFKKIELEGNAKQNTTTGKNLFDVDNLVKYGITDVEIESSISGNKVTLNGTVAWARVQKTMTFPANKTYTIMGYVKGTSGYRAGFVVNDENQTYNEYAVRTSGVKDFVYLTFNTNTYQTLIVQLYTNHSSTYGNATATFENVMIVEGTYTTEQAYEPYTGGFPSPNTDYPQDIEVVTGNNSILVEGKNKFNINDTYYKRLNIDTITTNNNNISVENTNTTTNQFVWWNIPVMIGEQITISYNSLTESTSDNNNGINYMFSDEPYTSFVNFDNFIKVNKTNKYATTTATKKYLVIGLRVIPSCTNICNKLQVELGSIATEYQKFQGRQTYSVNLGSIELCKIENNQDYIYKENNKWYKYSAIGKVILNGSSGENDILSNSNDNYTSFFYADENIGLSVPCFSNRLVYDSVTNNILLATSLGITTHPTVHRIYCSLPTSIASNINEIKTWLSNNNLIVYYVLATPTTTEITENSLVSQLNNLEKAYSYDTQTNISQINANKQFIINAEAIMSLQNILD